MKSLMFHCKNYEINLTGISNRPRNIKPEKVKEKNQVCKDCIVALITVEKQDNINKCLPELKKEILKFSKEVKSDKIVILPFAHLSNNLADSEISINFLNVLEDELKNEIPVLRSHFGSDKRLLLDIYGHKGNARFREF